MITVTQFKAKFSEFASIDDSVIQLEIDEAELVVSSNWGKFQDMGLYYYSAHNLTVSLSTADGDSSPSLTATAESVGNVSTSYGTQTLNNIDDSYYSSTAYGQKYLSFKMKIRVGAKLI